MRNSVCFLLMLIVASGVSACNATVDSNESLTLNRGLGGDADTLDPHRAHSTQAHKILEDLFQGLLEYSADGKLVQGVAENWTVSEDGLVYEFSLREDARWSNGSPVTADDFVYSFRRLVTPETAAFYSTFISMIKNAPEIGAGHLDPSELGVYKVNSNMLRIELARPTPYFLQLLTHAATYPLYAPSVERHMARFPKPGNLVSNGAYKIDNWSINSKISLSKNEYYWDIDNVAIKYVNWYPIVDATTEYNLYRTGDLDVTHNVAPHLFQTIKKTRPNELRIGTFLGLYYYGFNLTRAPFKDNRKIRRALSMAIDREVLVDEIIGRGEVAAYSWVPSRMEGYGAASLDFSAMDSADKISTAKRLYAEAGYDKDNPLQFELRYHVSDFEQKVAVAIQNMWRNTLGAEATLVNEEFSVLIANIRERSTTEAYRLSWIGDYNDPETFLSLMVSDNPSNLTGFANGEYDTLMRNAGAELSIENRYAILKQAEQLMLNEHVAIPLYHYVSKHLVQLHVKGWKNNILDRHPTRHLSIEVN